MSDDEVLPPPLSPVLMWSQAGHRLILYKGAVVIKNQTFQGQSSVDLGGQFAVRMCLDADGQHLQLGPTAVTLDHPELGVVTVPVLVTSSYGDGEVADAELGDGRQIHSVVAHVINFLWVLPADPIDDGSSVWAGRIELTGGGWHVTVDVRPDHSQVWADLRHTTKSVVTHVALMRRIDGGSFSAREAAHALEGWQMALSFAAGRWIAFAAPSGFDVTGHRIWEQWASWRHTTGTNTLTWWGRHNGLGLTEMSRHFMEAWEDDARRSKIRYVAHHLIASNEGATTVEARVMLLQSAMEYLAWVVYVVDGSRSKSKHKAMSAAEHLRELLAEASIDPSVPAGLPSLDRLGAELGHADAVETVVWIRNRFTHPKDADEPYRIEHLVSDTWRLCAEWAELILLHQLGYHGTYRSGTTALASDTCQQAVPWTSIK